MMKKISRCLDVYEKTVGTIVLLIMLALVTYQVLARFIFGSALRWSEELARYCMLYISFIGIGAGIKMHKHVGVEVLDSLLKENAKKIGRYFVAILTLIILIVFTYYTAVVTIRIGSSGQLSPAARLPMWVPYATIPIGFLGGIFRQIEEIVKIAHPPVEETEPAVQQEETTRG